jgi:hypothetical protein
MIITYNHKNIFIVQAKGQRPIQVNSWPYCNLFGKELLILNFSDVEKNSLLPDIDSLS